MYETLKIKLPRILVMILLIVLSTSVKLDAQQVKLKFTDTPLSTILKEITKQTGYNFVYSEPIVSRESKVSFNYEEEILSITPLLSQLFQNLPISFNISGKQVALAEKEITERTQQKTKVEQTIKGTVVDKESGDPIPGAGVVVHGTKKFAITASDGRFTIKAFEKEKLIITSLGYLDYEFIVGTDTAPTIRMTADNIMLDQVVVTGYQEISKNQLTSAVAVVKAENIAQLGALSIEQSLQGQIAGLSVINTSASPGAAPKIRVRGTSTLLGTGEPLWVLDGVILENSVPVTATEINSPDFMETFNSIIGGVSPNDIESITVLKDASATAIYGTRAANGVIVVTTKKGRKDATNISYRHSSGVRMRPHYGNFNMMNSKERVQVGLDMLEDNIPIYGNTGIEYAIRQYHLGAYTKEQFENEVIKLQEMNTDWFKLLFRNAYTQTHDFSVSGGSKDMDYYVSLGYNSEQGLDIASKFDTYSGMAKLNSEIFKGVKLGTALHFNKRNRETYHQSINLFDYAISTARTVPLYNEHGDKYFYMRNQNMFNIMNELDNGKRLTNQLDLKANLTLDVALYKGLNLFFLVSYQNAGTMSSNYATEKSHYVSVMRGYDLGNETEDMIKKSKLPFGGVYSEQNISQKTLIVRNSLDYNTLIADDKLSINTMIGQEFRATDYHGLTSNNYGYMHDRGKIFYNPAQTVDNYQIYRNKTERKLINRAYESYFSILTLAWQNKYVLNGNVRFDGSNLFGSNPKYRYLPLWSVSGKWNVSNEEFLYNSNIITNLALRASYGLRGNIVEESSPQIIANILPPNPITGLNELSVVQPPNPDLKWETTSSLNIGMELGLFMNRILFNVDWYRDLSKDLIAYNNISAVSGFTGKYVNYADIENKGVDISVTADIVRDREFKWQISLNTGYVKNEVLNSSLDPSVDNLVKSYYVPGNVMVGKPANSMWAYPYAGLDSKGSPSFYTTEGNIIHRTDSDMPQYVIDINNLVYMGSREPIINGGLSNVFKYKSFTLSSLLAFSLKSVVRLPLSNYGGSFFEYTNLNRDLLDRWRKPGDEVRTVIPGQAESTSIYTSQGAYFTDIMFSNSDYNVVSGDFLRLRSLTLEYKVSQEVLKRHPIVGKKIGDISIRAQAQNLFTIANKRLKGFDPETVNYSTNGYGSLPLPKTFTLGLNINF